MVTIRTSLHGRKLGITSDDALCITRDNGEEKLLGAYVTKRITSAQLLALNATPQTILAAQGAGIAIIPLRMAIYKPAGTAYAGIATGEDLVAKYTNGSGAQCTGVVETTGFLDQTSAQTRVVGMSGATGTTAGDYAPVANAAVVLHLLTGEITTGDSDIYVRLWFDLLKTAFTA